MGNRMHTFSNTFLFAQLDPAFGCSIHQLNAFLQMLCVQVDTSGLRDVAVRTKMPVPRPVPSPSSASALRSQLHPH